jgi:hypothetical protein
MLNGTMSTWLLDYFVPDGSPAEADATLAPLTERYIASAYWAFTTMTTVGYGDISANSVAERTFGALHKCHTTSAIHSPRVTQMTVQYNTTFEYNVVSVRKSESY